MSLKAILWALNDAPVDDPTHVLVLVALAERAGEDGTAAWPSQKWIAERARVSQRSVRRVLAVLEDQKTIRRGDQRFVAHLPRDRRPVVWDLSIERIRERDHRGDILTARSGRSSEPVQAVEETRPTGHERPVVDDRPDTDDRSWMTERQDTHDRTGGTPTSYEPVLEPSLNQGGSARVDTSVTNPPTPPPSKCPEHQGMANAPSCFACRDARLERQAWDQAQKDRAGATPTAPDCPDHPGHSSRNCSMCARLKAAPGNEFQAARARLRSVP